MVWFISFFSSLIPLENKFIFLSRFSTLSGSLFSLVYSILSEINQTKNIVGVSVFFMSLFLFIFLCNFFSLRGYVFSCTGHLVLNLSMGIIFWGFSLLLGIFKTPSKIISHFVPKNTPLLLLSFLIIIEILRVFIRPIVLAIRLRANLFAGHLLMCLISSFKIRLRLLFLGGTIQILFLFLEIIVSLIQAYIFSLLSINYIGDVIN